MKRRSSYLSTQTRGQKLHGSLFVVAWQPNAQDLARFGFTVSRKVGGAVIRNQVKRRLKEIVRQDAGGIHGVDVVLIARPSAANADFHRMRDEVGRALHQIRKRASAARPAQREE